MSLPHRCNGIDLSQSYLGQRDRCCACICGITFDNQDMCHNEGTRWGGVRQNCNLLAAIDFACQVGLVVPSCASVRSPKDWRMIVLEPNAPVLPLNFAHYC